ncbi:hypothetical protein, partial [Nocardioides aestuarii]
MSSRTTRVAAALLTAGALVLSLNSLSSPSVAAPNFKNAPTIKLQQQAGTGTLRAKPHGQVVSAPYEYFTMRVPADGSYHITMTGVVIPTTDPASYQCIVADKQKALANDLTGVYLINPFNSATDDGYNLDLEIDANLKKRRALIIGCYTDGDLQTPQPITYTFKKNGAFKNVNTTPFDIV